MRSNAGEPKERLTVQTTCFLCVDPTRALASKLKTFPFFLTFLFLLVAFVPGNAQDIDLSANYEWGPVRIGAGGWMRGMAVSPSDPTRMYARGDVDNMYRWDETAQRWFPTKVFGAMPANTTAVPMNGGGGAIAIDPSNPDHVLVAYQLSTSADLSATHPNLNLNVYSSTNGGLTFTAGNLSLSGSLSQETSGERLAIDPNNGNIAYFGSPGAQGATDGLYRSLDGGATWTLVSGGGYPADTASVRYEAQLPRFDGGSGTVSANGQTSTKTIYVTYIKHDETDSDAVIGGGTVKSSDGGLTWTDISNQDLAIQFSTVDTLGNLWVSEGEANHHIYSYSRAGAWTTSTPTYGGAAGIAVDPNNPNRIFASGGSNLARSLDGGKTWTDLGSNLQFSTTQTIEWLRPSSFRPQGHYVSQSGLYIDTLGRLWAPTGNDGIISTTPNDATDSASNPPVWTSVSEGIEEMVAEHAAIPPGGLPVVTVEDETLFTIQDPDAFTAEHFPINMWNGALGLGEGLDVSYSPNAPQYLAITSFDGAGWPAPTAQAAQYGAYSADGGSTWNLFPSETAGTHPCVLYGGIIAVSARAASHQNDPPGADNLVWIPTNDDNSAMSARVPAPFYSKDGGATWTQTAAFNSAPGASTGVSDCGRSWTYMGFQWGPWIDVLGQHLLVADPVTPGTFYWHANAGGFWKTTDGGVTWVQTPGSNEAPNYTHWGQMEAAPGVSGDLWLVDGQGGATAHGLYHTTDGGNSFTRNSAFDYAWELALGKPAAGASYPAIYVYGMYHGDPQWGIFQSTDGGNTFNRVSFYPDGILDMPRSLTASWDEFGLVYIGFAGNSYYYGHLNLTGTAPGAPVLAASAGDAEVRLSWQTSSTGGTPSGYNIYRGASPGGEGATPVASHINANTFTDSGLTNGQTYYYTVAAENSAGAGPASNEVSGTPISGIGAAPSFTIALSPASLAVQSGQQGATTVTVTAQNGFDSTVTFACSGLAPGASCSFSPTTVTPPGTTTTTVAITAQTLSTNSRQNSGPFLSVAACTFGLWVLGFRKRRQWRVVLGLVFLVAAAGAGSGALTGCGSSPSTTSISPVTSMVTVTATSGSIHETATLSLTVQ
ncbi:MAG: fibronectin type III domain-containing protein [Terracidiphilus sp.]